jgi:hypothetical protein
MKDGERQKVYDAESFAFEGSIYEASIGMFELRAVAARLCALQIWRRGGGGTIVVREARVDALRSSAHKSTSEIRIAAGQDSVATLAHEGAHLISGDGHGPEFRSRHVEVLRVLAGADASNKLREVYRGRGLGVGVGEVWHVEEPICRDVLAGLVGIGAAEVAKERMRRRVAGLLAKAQSTTEAEAESLRIKAFELAHNHGVVDALSWDVERSEKIIEREIFLGSGPYVAIRGGLLGALAGSQMCRVVWVATDGGRLVYLSGFEGDVARTRAMFLELDVAGRRAVGEVREVGNVVAFRRAWLGGYVAGITDALRGVAERAEESQGESGVSLVLVERGKLVDDYVKRRWGRIRSVSLSTPRGAAFSAGRTYGRERAFSGELGVGVLSLGAGGGV